MHVRTRRTHARQHRRRRLQNGWQGHRNQKPTTSRSRRPASQRKAEKTREPDRAYRCRSFACSFLLALPLLLPPRLFLGTAAGRQAFVEVDGERVQRVLRGLGLEVVAALLREVAAALLLALALAVKKRTNSETRNDTGGRVGGT